MMYHCFFCENPFENPTELHNHQSSCFVKLNNLMPAHSSDMQDYTNNKNGYAGITMAPVASCRENTLSTDNQLKEGKLHKSCSVKLEGPTAHRNLAEAHYPTTANVLSVSEFAITNVKSNAIRSRRCENKRKLNFMQAMGLIGDNVGRQEAVPRKTSLLDVNSIVAYSDTSEDESRSYQELDDPSDKEYRGSSKNPRYLSPSKYNSTTCRRSERSHRSHIVASQSSSMLYTVPYCSPLGQLIKPIYSGATTMNKSFMNRSLRYGNLWYEQFCKNNGRPYKASSFPVRFRPSGCSKVVPYCHSYKFNRKHRKEFMIRMCTGLSKRSRKLKAQTKTCTVRLVNIKWLLDYFERVDDSCRGKRFNLLESPASLNAFTHAQATSLVKHSAGWKISPRNEGGQDLRHRLKRISGQQNLCSQMQMNLPSVEKLSHITFICHICGEKIQCLKHNSSVINEHYIRHGVSNIDVRPSYSSDGKLVLNVVQVDESAEHEHIHEVTDPSGLLSKTINDTGVMCNASIEREEVHGAKGCDQSIHGVCNEKVLSQAVDAAPLELRADSLVSSLLNTADHASSCTAPNGLEANNLAISNNVDNFEDDDDLVFVAEYFPPTEGRPQQTDSIASVQHDICLNSSEIDSVISNRVDELLLNKKLLEGLARTRRSVALVMPMKKSSAVSSLTLDASHLPTKIDESIVKLNSMKDTSGIASRMDLGPIATSSDIIYLE